MGTEQLENKDREGKKRIIIASPGKPTKEVWTYKTFPPQQIREYMRKHAPKPIDKFNDMQGPHIISQITKSDLIWLAYQRGFRDGQRKERES